MLDYQARIDHARAAIAQAEIIFIGGGAGLSDAAGLTYSGKRFTENFAPFIERYGFTDLYTSSFHPFETEEERWAYWAKHIAVNRYDPPATKLYQELLRLVEDKEHFVITTNVDYQFHKTGFAADNVWMVQGDYGKLQCGRACHEKLYDNEDLVKTMISHTRDCKIPSSLIPKCPVCGGRMDVHIHSNQYFIMAEEWEAGEHRFTAFTKASKGRRTVLLELGVGFNTPSIIRYPFEQLAYQNPHATLIRLNRDYLTGAKENVERTIPFDEDMAQVLGELSPEQSVGSQAG